MAITNKQNFKNMKVNYEIEVRLKIEIAMKAEVKHVGFGKAEQTNKYIMTQERKLKLASYLVSLSKSTGRDLDYTIGSVWWHTVYEKDTKDVESLVKLLWNN